MNPVTLYTPLCGQWPGVAEQLADKVGDSPYFKPLELASLYIEIAAKFNLRADILWAMARLETADFKFGGRVKPTDNNLCGLRKPDGSGFYSFDTPREGVIAHVAHLSWHVYSDHVNAMCSKAYDPKHGAHRNDMGVVGDLDIWSTAGYAKKIVKLANE